MRRSKLPALRPAKVPAKAKKQAAPKAELDLSVDKSISLSTLRSTDGIEAVIKPSKPLLECPPKDQQKLLLEKCHECCVICDFSSANADAKAKQTKATLLKHIAAAFTIPHLVRSMQTDTINEFLNMLSVNLFRPFPTIPSVSPIDAHDSLSDASWPHLSLVYDSLLASLNCPLIQNSITTSFLYKLIGNCVSPDDREKAVVRDILHALYTKFIHLREIVRSNIAYQFSNNICSSELMEFFLSIVSGFNAPLKQDHVDFYYKYVLPLHCTQKYSSIQRPFVQCTVKFIQKSILLFTPTVMYIAKHWPCSDRRKQIDFLNELTTLLSTFELNVSPKVASTIFKIVGDCVESENTDVSEASVDFLMNPELASVIRTHSTIVFPIVIEPIYRAAKHHWDECTKTNAYVVLQVLSEIDNQTFNKANDAHKLMKAQKSASFAVFKNNWTRIFENAKSADKSMMSANFDCVRDR
ncbi:phosphoprotein phosphatase, putative [Trichomonas vaginalis G3]|uniref:Phosphoprotein phosphatase, putative n=1 Tax=Trichomonas vaginalis (strain ATCC PRA-98 / G3) TaxID=412133 RepID=A2FKE5_TRIV3|nr:protein phosphatase regulator protein [Trichomonas vaginalis G3]EAX94611.1 phosphoprotein phosphatase, putative [Trichomonas vaginalis G3]KAI5553721.1 protein phosphatase regulator protein [Trichomonas vaginalis G3]|eukprot:XP_001307541.1 phosphoprotein phosphatase [Trichomonas vaginalis G3]